MVRIRLSMISAVLFGFLLLFTPSVFAEPEVPGDGPPAARNLPQSPDAPADFVINDDAIIQGRLCAGLFCVNAESFGTESLRLKSTTTHLRFEDVSTGNQPGTDWQISINGEIDFSSNYFAIDDMSAGTRPFFIAGSAADNSIRVTSSGAVGLGTAAPVAPLTVERSDGSARLHIKETSASAAERTLAILSNKGAINLQFDNTDVNRQWSMGVRSGGDFRIQSNQAAGGVINFLMNLDGALTLSGNLTVGSCSGCTAIRSAGDQLASLSGLTFRRWTTRDAVEHFGPDPAAFHQLTGLGAGPEGIAPLDVASVALATTQHLEARIQSLEAENVSLKARLAALEAALGVDQPAQPQASEQIYLPSTGR